jgi:uncharacterized damage-inducible protein DinB
MMNKPESKLSLIRLFYSYNSWATTQLIDKIVQLDRKELEMPGCSGHGSILETMAHFLTTQWGWFSWFDKSKSVQDSMMLRVSPEEIESPEKLQQRWRDIENQTIACLEKLMEDDLDEEWSASTPGGFSMTLPLWKLLLHVANHGTHTRAQIISAVRRLSHDPGSYEFFQFALSQA